MFVFTLIRALFGNSSNLRNGASDFPFTCPFKILAAVKVDIPIPSPKKRITFFAGFALTL